MDRNNSRYTFIRRQGQSQQQQQQISPPSGSNNPQQQQHIDNHRNSSLPSSANTSYTSAMSREPLKQHDELIRYIREAWTNVYEHGTPVVYRNESDHQLKNFKPFDLEEFWGQRLVQNIHVSHGHQ